MGIGIDDRTDGDRRFLRVPELEQRRVRHEPLDDRFVDVTVDDQAGGGRALAPRTRRRLPHRGDGLVGIGVGVDDDRVLPAELGDDPPELALPGPDPRRGGQDRQSHRSGTGEGDDGHARMGHQVGADDLALPGQEGEHAGREAGRSSASTRRKAMVGVCSAGLKQTARRQPAPR